MSKKLYLLDAYALIFRAYYAFIKNPRINSKGLNTSAIFGFTNTIFELITKNRPSHIAVVFDPPTPTFRHETYKEYKANRDATPEDIKLSVPYIKQIIEAMNIPVISVDGFEADDVIGTLAKKAEKDGFRTFMMTPDKDFAQLVSENIFIYKPRRSGSEIEIWGINEVKSHFGLSYPEQMIDLLGLMGDNSDNIPGAPGIGEKTAQKLLAEFGTIENIIQNSSKLKGKIKESIENNIDQIKLSKFLSAIKTDVEIEFDESKLILENFNKQKLKEIFEELEFRTISEKIINYKIESNFEINEDIQQNLFSNQPSLFDNNPIKIDISNKYSFNKDDVNYYLIETQEERTELIKKLEASKEFCFDTETTNIDPNLAELVGIAFCIEEKDAFYISVPLNRDDVKRLLAEFKHIFENENIAKVGQNIKYDIIVLSWYEILVKGRLYDTMIAHYILNPDSKHNLDTMAENILNYNMIPIEDLIGKKGKNQLSMRLVDNNLVKDYACEDADITLRLKNILFSDLDKNKLMVLYEKVEEKLIYVLADIEKTGIKLNKQELINYSVELKKEIFSLEEQIYTLSGHRFNIASPKQLGEVLFEHMNIVNNAKKTKTKQYATGEEILIKIKDKHPIIEKILDYRTLTKLTSTYVDALPQLINPKTRRVHSSYNQAVASTGRLSSNNPNMQNIPIRDVRGKEIRKAFVPENSDYVFLSADYSQVELRLMAHLSGDENMISAFNNNEDIHTSTAAKIYKIGLAEVTKDMRYKAKTANFGIIYGVSAFGLSEQLYISRKDAKDLIDNYFIIFPKVKDYMDKSIENARKLGYVETIFGRRRFLTDINSNNSFVRSFAERNAINAPIQGSAADIIKIAMVNIFEIFKKKNFKSKMIIQVHDELDFEIHKSELEEAKQIIISQMQDVVQLKVPLIAELGLGDNWLEAH